MSCQDTCVFMEGDGRSEFYREATRRARKSYRCEECRAVIAIGDSHHYSTGKSDGDFWEARTCAPCQEIRKTFACDGWVVSMLWESMDEQVFPDWNEMVAIDCLARLTSQAAIDKMRAKYAEYTEASS